MSLNRSCRLFGHTKQACYKRYKKELENEAQDRQALELVRERRLKLGRDRLF
ncbi:hypothetical protein ACXYMU_16465 [Pontibacter sp. CAU 1760]